MAGAGESCSDGWQNQDETDVDCGGSVCGATCLTGQSCGDGTDCVGGECTDSVCAPSCTDSEQNQDEIGVDCGGLCPGCPDGTACTTSSDCASAVCYQGTCGARSCSAGLECNGESCCTTLLVEGGTFERGDAGGYPATVGSFCLDKYEVTVGRFRAFVEDYDSWISAPGGSHPLLGEGEITPGDECGWKEEWTWNGKLAESSTVLQESIAGFGGMPTWQASAGTAEEESRPMNFLTWYEAFAFCLWDGGRLASETEWEYAAAGGALERPYPWGDQEPDYTRAVYDCAGSDDVSGGCTGADILPVGSKPDGAGYWGHLDLVGSVHEWVFDCWDDLYMASCVDCAALPDAPRVFRGGAYSSMVEQLPVASRSADYPEIRFPAFGARCARPAP